MAKKESPLIGLNLEHDDPIVRKLATIFVVGLQPNEINRCGIHLNSGVRVLCGNAAHWWWHDGLADPSVLAAFTKIPKGKLNTFSYPACEYTRFSQHERNLQRVLSVHRRLCSCAKSFGIDYVDLLETAKEKQAREALEIAVREHMRARSRE
jgi:hypothetical protein